MNRELIGQAISNYTPSNNRSQTTTTGRNTVLLDAYNANPSSMTGALNSFAKNIKGDKLVILGDMRELGNTRMKLIRKLWDFARG